MNDQSVAGKFPTNNNHWITATHLYVIEVIDRGPVKIGISAEPVIRLRALQIGYPYRLEILARCCGGEEPEATVHALFGERLLGEWFRRSARVRIFIDMISCGVGLSMAIERCQTAAKAAIGAIGVTGDAVKPFDGRR
jgi:hypothetical protein